MALLLLLSTTYYSELGHNTINHGSSHRNGMMDSVKFLLGTRIPSGNCKNHSIRYAGTLIWGAAWTMMETNMFVKKEKMIWQLLVFIRFTGSLKTHTLSPHYNFLWWVSTKVSELLLFVGIFTIWHSNNFLPRSENLLF